MTHKEDPGAEGPQNLKDWKPKEPRRPFKPKPGSFGPSMKFKIPGAADGIPGMTDPAQFPDGMNGIKGLSEGSGEDIDGNLG